ncbi:MAG TPA: glycine betaine ABC transporter substrate-binding protein [Acidimicrobiales bacterium]|nr:glycine betaine ABC transporter substrate-binding protein [Acidimicrobiales bacterium]
MTKFRQRRLLWRSIGALFALTMIAAACGDDDESSSGDGDANGAAGSIAEEFDFDGLDITVGSKDFTEQLVLGEILVQALEAGGADVDNQVNLGGTNVNREALLAGEIDTYWEYNGTGWITHLGETDPIPDRVEQYEAVRDRDLEENGIVWYEPAPFNNTYALAVRSEAQADLGVETLSDIGTLIAENPDAATLCVETEFEVRDDGLPGMEATYGYEFPDGNVSVLDTGIIYQETDSGDTCNFGEVFTTDGRIAALDLFVLEDDQSFFPLYNPSVNIRQEIDEEFPQVADLASQLALAIDNETMQRLNAAVDVDGEEPADVARDWLAENGFIG